MTMKEDIASIKTMVEIMHVSFLEVKKNVRKNTKFRDQAAGFIAGISFIGALIGSAITLIVTKIWK